MPHMGAAEPVGLALMLFNGMSKKKGTGI